MISKIEKNMIRSMENYQNQVMNCIPKNILVKKNDGYSFACILLLNVYKSFGASVILYKNSFSIESYCVFRFIFEQLCYCMAIFEKPFEEISKIEVTKCVKYIKLLNVDFPKLYGLLSNFAHFHVSNIFKIITMEESPESELSIEIKSKEYQREENNDVLSTFVLITLLYYYVVDYITHDRNIDENKRIKKIGNRLMKTIRNSEDKFNLYE
jgi:hypothetical protein